MTTFTIQIGNSDDKLSQQEWSAFVLDFRRTVEVFADAVHFYGYSEPGAPWQNCCAVINIQPDAHAPLDQIKVHDERLIELESQLLYLARKYRQDSIALTPGQTRFIRILE